MLNKYNSTLESQQKCFMVVQLLKGNSSVGREVFEFETEYIQYRIQIRPMRDNGFVEQKYSEKNPENTFT